MEEAFLTFKNYVKNFDQTNHYVKLKIDHTFRVVELAQKMALKLHLNEPDTKLIKLIALLHDIGRFKQIEEKNSFIDTTFDHAAYGVKYLFFEDHIKDYPVLKKDYDLVKEAIFYHNKYALDIPQFSKRKQLFVDLIRDIDKIDILYTNYLEMPLAFTKTDVPQEYYMAFYNHQSVKNDGHPNASKSFVLTCGYIYDFNFRESLELLQELGYLDLYFAKVQVDADSEKEFSKIKKAVYTKLKEDLC